MKKIILILGIFLSISFFNLNSTTIAQPYGKGIYNEIIPYGDLTSLSIATDGDIVIPITPTSEGSQSTANSKITVTSTDVKGFKLYIKALNSSDMDNLGAKLPASSNSTPAELAMNTWGYNLDESINFIGITTTDKLIRSVSLPTPLGDTINVMFGMKLDLSKPAGNYTATVLYTAVPQTD